MRLLIKQRNQYKLFYFIVMHIFILVCFYSLKGHLGYNVEQSSPFLPTRMAIKLLDIRCSFKTADTDKDRKYMSSP